MNFGDKVVVLGLARLRSAEDRVCGVTHRGHFLLTCSSRLRCYEIRRNESGKKDAEKARVSVVDEAKKGIVWKADRSDA